MRVSRPRVVLLRGHQANSWHLRPFRHLAADFDLVALRTGSNWFDTSLIGLREERAYALRDVLPPGRVGHLLSRIPGDRYLRPARHLSGADIVHSQDLGFWYSMQAARLKARLGYKLVLTVWETIPFLDAYRNIRTRPYRRLVLDQTDLFLAATARARECLLLEGAPAERILLCPPGIDDEMFRTATPDVAAAGVMPRGASQADRSEHVVVSSGRLVWDKGHQDVMRALALLRRERPGLAKSRLVVMGSGPEEGRLRRYAAELGLADAVEFAGNVPYSQTPALYANASCLVLASLPIWSWEEQFGMAMLEAMFAGVPVLASTSGAIPEVTRGTATLFAPGDWIGLAAALERGPLAAPPDSPLRVPLPPELEVYSGRRAAERLAEAYERVLRP